MQVGFYNDSCFGTSTSKCLHVLQVDIQQIIIKMFEMNVFYFWFDSYTLNYGLSFRHNLRWI